MCLILRVILLHTHNVVGLMSTYLYGASGTVQADLLVVASNGKLFAGRQRAVVLWLPGDGPHLGLGVVGADACALSDIPELDRRVRATETPSASGLITSKLTQ
jgi:hypothetical protein